METTLLRSPLDLCWILGSFSDRLSRTHSSRSSLNPSVSPPFRSDPFSDPSSSLKATMDTLTLTRTGSTVSILFLSPLQWSSSFLVCSTRLAFLLRLPAADLCLLFLSVSVYPGLYIGDRAIKNMGKGGSLPVAYSDNIAFVTRRGGERY